MGKLLVINSANFSSVAVDVVTPLEDRIAITVLASPNGGGTVTGSGSYEEGTIVQITATANEDYRFVSWNDGNTNATRSITVGSSPATYTAQFVAIGRQYIWDDVQDIIEAATTEIKASSYPDGLLISYCNKFENETHTVSGISVKCTSNGTYKVYLVNTNTKAATLLKSYQCDGTQSIIHIDLDEPVTIGNGYVLTPKVEGATSGVLFYYTDDSSLIHEGSTQINWPNAIGSASETVKTIQVAAPQVAIFPYFYNT